MNKLIPLLITTTFFLSSSCKNLNQEKINSIITNYKLVEAQKLKFEFKRNIFSGINMTKEDDERLVEIETELNDNKIKKLINQSFEEFYSEKQIDSVYNNILNDKSDTIFNSLKLGNNISLKFKYIYDELNSLERKYIHIGNFSSEKTDSTISFKNKKENGFYLSSKIENIDTISQPSIPLSLILTAYKKYDFFNKRIGFEIIFKPAGKVKLSELSKVNIGKNLTFLLENKVIVNPVFLGQIKTGKLTLSNERYSEDEIDAILKKINDET